MAATMTVTFNGVAIEMTSDDPEELVRMTSLLTALEGPAKNAPKGRKETKAEAAPEVRYVTKRSLGAFNKATGRNFRKQTTAAKALYEGKVKAEGWAVGPNTIHYFETGQWPS